MVAPLSRRDFRPSLFPDLTENASPLLQQALRPRPVADAQNSLIGLNLRPPGATMPLADILSAAVNGNPQLAAMNPPTPTGSPEMQAWGGGPTATGSPEMQAWGGGVPLPPPRPGGGGSAPPSPSRSATPAPSGRPQIQGQAQAPSNPFTTVTAPNSDPTARNRPQITALNLAGLFGGGAPASAPAAPVSAPVQAQAGGRTAPVAGWTFDENGNPIPDYGPALQRQYDPTELGGEVGKAGWYKGL